MNAAALPLDRFAPVSLDELVAEAGLMTRVDRKYLVPLDEAVAVLDGLDPRTRVLELDGRRSLSYDSVYFDTPDRVSYRLTAQRRRRRFKLRTRRYLDTGAAFLELKTKGGRGATVKDRMAYDPADCERITAEGRDYAAAVLRARGQDPSPVSELEASLVSRYRRSTLLTPKSNRITVDTRLLWAAPDGSSLELPRYAIVESKSTGAADEVDLLLWRRGHRPSRISKFGTGTAALHPELPRNKWARLLNGPFASQTPTSPTAPSLEGTS